MKEEKEKSQIEETPKETAREGSNMETQKETPHDSAADIPHKIPMEIPADLSGEERKHRRHTSSRLTLWILIGVAVLICMGMLTIAPYMMNGSQADVTFRIPKGATIDNVQDTLTKYFGEDYTRKVTNLLSLYRFNPEERHGSYLLPKGATPFATMRKLSRGGQTPVRLTINGFRSLPYLAERMCLKMEFTPEEFLEAATDSAYLAQYGLTPEQALSLFLEDTYDVYWTASPREVLDKIGANYKAFWTEGKTEDAEELGLSPAQMMTLASIVDYETNQKREKGRIGRLYINRLDKGMKLQADPTVKFALNDLSIQRVTNDHLKVDSPYNTYKYAGLPPGPLRTTSRETVESILQSEPSADLYMCARPDFSGYHNFAPTYEEHLENARLYQQELDERGIK